MKLNKNNTLSVSQKQVVNAPLPTVTLACAGTGKTHTMIHRVIKAHQVDQIALNRIFVTTFTRKAATEMTNRMINIINDAPKLIGTFHRNALQLIKSNPILVKVHGYDDHKIKMIDVVDRDRLFKEFLDPYIANLKKQEITMYEAKKFIRIGIDICKKNAIYPIDYHHNKGYLPEDFDELNIALSIFPREIFDIVYKNYQEKLKEMNAVDYDDIIALPVFAMRDESIVKPIASKFDLVIADEFQDNSKLQFELLDQLSQGSKNLFLVGDEDQLIYAWRDADLSKVMSYYTNDNFQIKYLEENYRSQKNIIELAVAIISQNTMRSSKTMKAMKHATSDIIHVQPYDHKEEAAYVAQDIRKTIANGVAPEDIAIIYRSNDYRIFIEKELVKQKIDYNVVRAYNFFEYTEVKALLSYLQLALDSNNDIAFKNIFNYPKRGNGEKALQKVTVDAHLQKSSLFNALKYRKKNTEKNQAFIALLSKLKSAMDNDIAVGTLLDMLVSEIELERNLLLEHGIEEGEKRFDNIQRLEIILDDIKREVLTYENTLVELQEVILDLEKSTIKNKVQLMTAHTSKGLEFENVYIVGAVNGMFPSLKGSSNSNIEDEKEDYVNTSAEEERRLLYVAITRAKENLTISSPKYIYRQGSISEYEPSMFLEGMDSYYVEKAVAIDENS